MIGISEIFNRRDSIYDLDLKVIVMGYDFRVVFNIRLGINLIDYKVQGIFPFFNKKTYSYNLKPQLIQTQMQIQCTNIVVTAIY